MRCTYAIVVVLGGYEGGLSLLVVKCLVGQRIIAQHSETRPRHYYVTVYRQARIDDGITGQDARTFLRA